MGIWNWLDWAMGLIYEVCHGGIRHWLYQGHGVDLQGRVMGAPDWMWHWLDRGDGIVSWGHATLAGAGQWVWFMAVYCHGAHDTGWIRVMGLIYGGVPWGMQHGLDRGNRIDLWDMSWGHTTGSGRWDWLEGARHWDLTLAGTRHGGATGSERWDWFVGARHGGATLAGCELWDWFMGVFHGARNWIGAMELICGGEPCMTLARSGWRDWFMWERHEGARQWLDWGYGIDLWGPVEWQSTIWLLNVNECKWQSTIYGCYVNDNTMCLMSGVEVSVQRVFG